MLRPPAKTSLSMCPVTSAPPSPDYPGATTQIAFQERLPNSGGQWLCCLWQKRPFLRRIKFLIERKNSKNVTAVRCNFMWVFTDSAAQCSQPTMFKSESISSPDACLLLSSFPLFKKCMALNLINYFSPCMCDVFRPLLYFLLIFICLLYMTWLTAHLCLQLCDDDRGIYSH